MIRPSLLVALFSLLTHSPAHAHRMLVSIRQTESELTAEAYYEDDSPADGAKIQLRQRDEILLEGTADENGTWKTARPTPGEYVLRAEHYGHVALEPFTVPEAGMDAKPPPTPHVPAGVRWSRIIIGLGLIAGFFVVIWVVRRGRK